MSVRTDYIECCDNIVGLKSLPNDSIDLTVTSPPYDNLRTYKGFTWDTEALIAELYRVTKPGGVVVWIVSDATIKGSETGSSFRQALAFMDAGFNLHDTMIWEKTGNGCLGSQKAYGQVFEYMFVFAKGGLHKYNLIADRENKIKSGKVKVNAGLIDGKGYARIIERKPFGKRTNIWRINQQQKSPHPAPFPEQLAQDHILSWSNPGDLVLDPFMGSGTTAVVCLQTGRRYIGFEIAEEYCEMARQRIRAEIKQQEGFDAERSINREE